MERRFIDDKHLKLAIALKTNQLKREQLSSLTFQHVEAALQEMVWKHNQPRSMHEAIDDVFHLTANEVVAFLSNQAVIMGSQMSLHDLKNIIGGK